MRTLLLFVALKTVALAYSGADLNGTLTAGHIATLVFLYADEHGGKVDIPYSEIPSVAAELKSFPHPGVFAFPSQMTYSFDKSKPVPVVFYSVGNMVAVGFSDLSHSYYKVDERPPWAGLRHGLSCWEWTIVGSFL